MAAGPSGETPETLPVVASDLDVHLHARAISSVSALLAVRFAGSAGQLPRLMTSPEAPDLSASCWTRGPAGRPAMVVVTHPAVARVDATTTLRMRISRPARPLVAGFGGHLALFRLRRFTRLVRLDHYDSEGRRVGTERLVARLFSRGWLRRRFPRYRYSDYS